MIWTIIIGVIVLGVIIGAMQISADNDSRATNALAVAKIPGYNPAVQYDGGTKKAGVSLDPTSSRFAITISGRPKVYNFSDLIAVEVVRDGQTLTKTNRGSQAVGAARRRSTSRSGRAAYGWLERIE